MGLKTLQTFLYGEYEKRMETNFRSVFEERFTTGQNPALLWIGCSDSFCLGLFGEHVSPQPDLVFTGDNPGNSLVTSIVDGHSGQPQLVGNATLDYFMSAIVPKASRNPYYVMVVGHTDCGAIKAILSGYEKLSPSLIAHLQTLESGLNDIMPTARSMAETDPARAAALLAQANVDFQIAQARALYPLAQKVEFIGLMQDLTGRFYAPESKRRGDLFVVNVNGRNDFQSIQHYLSDTVEMDEAVSRYLARRLPAVNSENSNT